jgi:hypothetical protein
MALLLLQEEDFPRAKTSEPHKALQVCGRRPRKPSEVCTRNIGDRERRDRSSFLFLDCQSDIA